MPELKEIWKKALGAIQTDVNAMTFKTWFAKTSLQNLSDQTAVIAMPSSHAKKYLLKFESVIQTALHSVTGKDFPNLEFIVEQEMQVEANDFELGPIFEDTDSKSQIKNDLQQVDNEKSKRSGLSPRFSFENYLVGSHNQLAFAIAKAIAENPGKEYNPFFLYSGVGLGKTHLMQAVGLRIMQKNPKMHVLYTTGESFMNELIESIQHGKGGKYTSNEFRRKFRTVDVLLIDDIHSIVGKESTQQEFFHTFNTLYMEGKQIVLTSDRPPKDFTTLEKRITSRFSSGIIADIQHPDLDTRIAILRTKRDTAKDLIPNQVIDYIAENVNTNIRELEGTYMQFAAHIKVKGLDPTIEAAQEVIGKNGHEVQTKRVNLNQILKAVCKYYSVKSEDIKGKKRTKDLVIPRQVAMYLIKDLTHTPYIAIGEFLGGRDHTTIMYGVQKVEQDLIQMRGLREDVVNVKQLL